MILCPSCGSFHKSTACPHCDGSGARLVGAALLLGVALTACKDGGDGDAVALYGVAQTGLIDEDEDGYSIDTGDCDDGDPAIHPDATETAGDSIDSNCDGNDDT